MPLTAASALTPFAVTDRRFHKATYPMSIEDKDELRRNSPSSATAKPPTCRTTPNRRNFHKVEK